MGSLPKRLCRPRVRTAARRSRPTAPAWTAATTTSGQRYAAFPAAGTTTSTRPRSMPSCSRSSSGRSRRPSGAPKRFDAPGHASPCRPYASPCRYTCGHGRAEPSLHTRLARYRRHYSELYLVRSGALPPIPTHMRLALRAAAEHSLLRLFQPMQVPHASRHCDCPSPSPDQPRVPPPQWSPRPVHTRLMQLAVLLALLQLKASAPLLSARGR